MSPIEEGRAILDKLVEKHGSETFVSDGYAYYDDALSAITEIIKERNKSREVTFTKKRCGYCPSEEYVCLNCSGKESSDTRAV